MKNHSRNTRGPGAWVLGGVASVLMCVSAFGQYVATQNTPISIPDHGNGNPYPSSLDLTKSNITGVIEKVTVTVSSLTHPSAPDVGLLLVGPGPNSNAVVLMGNSGGNPSGSAALNGVTLIFSDDASSSLPATSPLVSGSSYKPTDNTGGSGLSFGPPAPTGGYSNTLASAFKGANPNGVWSLYVLDTTPGPSTTLTPALGSWSLNLYTTPTVAVQTNASTLATNIFGNNALTTVVNQDSSVVVNLVVGSSSVDPSTLTVVATTNNLVTNATYFAYGGSGANRTVTISPNPHTYGTNTLTITVKDGVGSVSTNITLAVSHIDQVPLISLSTNTLTTIAGHMTTNLVIASLGSLDPAFHPTNALNLVALSSDSTIVSPSSVFFTTLDALGSKRAIAVVPTGKGTGTATITVQVDNSVKTNTATFSVTVLPVTTPMIANTSPISLSSSGTTNSTITVPANTIQGLVGNLTVSLSGLTLPSAGGSPNTISLTAPNGQVVQLIDDSAASTRNYGQVIVADGASGSLPNNDNLTNAIAIAPVSALGALQGVNPNGTWTLSINNPNTGTITLLNGWTLTITVGPVVGTVSPNPVLGNEESTQTATFTVTSVDSTITNIVGIIPSPGNPNLAKFSYSLNGNNATLTIVGQFNQFGTNLVQAVATDKNGYNGTNTFNLGLAFVNHPPQLSFIPRQVIAAGAFLSGIDFNVKDVDTPINQVTVRATSDNQKLIPDSNIIITPLGTGGGNNTNYALTIFPIGTVSGSANITVIANDNMNAGGGPQSGSTTFNVFVQVPDFPLFAFPNGISINTSAPGTPYAATNVVSGLIGSVEKVKVTLFGLTAPTPQNVQILLVGPNLTTNTLLLANSGSGGPANNATVVFDDYASGGVPASGVITSGSYQPTQNGFSGNLPAPAPAQPYGPGLFAFTNVNPNGNWLLFVNDIGSTSKGAIAGGWQLSIQTSPSIPTIKDQYTSVNVATNIQIVVGDNQPGANLTVTATPADPTLIQTPIGVTLSGSSAVLHIAPQPYKSGTNVITVNVVDAAGHQAQATFNLGVAFAAQPPLFTSVPGDQTVPAATQLGPLGFKIFSPQGNTLTVNASSLDNPGLIPSVTVSTDPPNNSGNTNAYTLTLIPAGVATGTGTVTIAVNDSGGLKSSASFKVVVTPSLAFANTNSISIPPGPTTPGQLSQGAATPYPAVIVVKGIGGVVSSVQATLVGLNHQHPEDLDILLVAPDNSTAVMLMAHAGVGSPANGLRLNFSDAAGGAAPQNGALQSQSYQVSDYSGGIVLPAPAPLRPYKTGLSAFNGLNPNGNWQLFVLDDTFPTGGSIDNGWVLFIQTAPAVASIGPQTTPENKPLPLALNISSASTDPTNILISVATSGDLPPGLVDPTNLVVTGTGASRTLTITPTTNLPSAFNVYNGLPLSYTNRAGTNLVIVTAADPINKLTNSIKFPLTVTYVNQSPIISTVVNTNSYYLDENTFTTISYNYLDVDSTNYLTNIVATSSNQGLLANSNIVVTITGGQASNTRIDPSTNAVINVKVTPTKNVYGSLTLTLTGTDGNSSTTNQVTLNINHIWQQPTISHIPDQPGIVGAPTTNIAFTIGSVEVPAANLLVFATSDKPSLVPNSSANIVLGGSGANRTIQLFPIGNVSDTANITVFVTDLSVTNANSTNSVTFALNATTVGTTFANTAPITTSGVNPANIYPSTINIAPGTLQGPTFKVDIILPSLSHSSPANLDILLEEDGADLKTNAVVLMSGAGGSTAVSNIRLQFDDAGNVLPAGTLTAGTYAPANYTKGLVLPSPAPTNGIWKATLGSAFATLNPNGLWKLFVNDRGAGDSGNIASGWQLVIQTAPTIVAASGTPSPLVIVENSTNTLILNLGDMAVDVTNLTVTGTSDNQTLIPNRNITFAKIASSGQTGPSTSWIGTVQATIVPAFLQSGSNNVTFTVTRSDGASSSFTLPVKTTAINVPPTISRLDPVSINENTTSNITVIVSDVDTPQSALNVVATSDNQTLIPSSSIVFLPQGTNRLFGLPANNGSQSSILTVQLKPTAFQVGTATISITVTDAQPAGLNIVSNGFVLTVNPVVFSPYFITSPGNQSVAAGGTLPNIPFAVGSPTPFVSATTLTNGVTSSDKTLIDPAKITFTQDASGTNRTVTILAEKNTAGGVVLVTLIIGDPATGATSTAKFNVNVRPTRVLNFANTRLINIIDNSAADVYPSQITVSNLVGPIGTVTATLKGFTHSFASDVGVLLVGPTGQKIVLMNNVATGRPGPTNVNLTFDESASTAMPLNVPLASGTYLPLDNSGGRIFQGPAPLPPYTNTLNAYTNSSPNGVWSIYVEDFVLGDAGAISNGWSLGITTLPVISGVTDLTTNENSSAVQSFTVLDDNTNNQSFTFTTTSDNQAVVTNNGVVFTGSGRNYTMTVNPLPNVFGSANITLNMLNGDGQTVSTKFKVTFNKVLYTPTIAPIADQTIPAGTAASVPLVYGSIGYSQNQLTVAFQSSNTNLVPVANMKLVGTNLLISPVGVQQGTATLTVSVTNPDSLSTNASFKLTVGPNLTPVFAQSQKITINDNAAATPYPSTLTVAGVVGNVTNVTATLNGVTHALPSDISVLLVGPQGQTVVLMSRAGGSSAISNTRLQFADTATPTLPQFSQITDGTYKPSDYKASDTFFPPVPSAPYGHTMSVFNGVNPNGTWALYVQDDVPQNSGVISGGWVLSIQTDLPQVPPVISPITNQFTLGTRLAATTKVNFSVNPGGVAASNVTVTASADNTNLVSSVTVASAGNGTNFTASIVVAATNVGTAHITISAQNAFGTGTNQFLLTVTKPATPVLAPIAAQTTPYNNSTNVTLGLTSSDTPLTSLLITATDTNSALLKNVSFAVTSSNAVATLNVVSNMVGFDFVTIHVSDGFTNVTQSFPFTVTPIGNITMLPIGTQNTVTNTPAKVALNITSPSTSVTNLTLKGTSTNTTLVSGITFAYNGRNMVATINLFTNKAGVDFVTISATDGFSTAAQSFVLTVTGQSSTVAPPATLTASASGNQLTVNVDARSSGVYNYIIQISSDLKGWSNYTNITTAATGKFTGSVAISPTVKDLFIRAQSQ